MRWLFLIELEIKILKVPAVKNTSTIPVFRPSTYKSLVSEFRLYLFHR